MNYCPKCANKLMQSQKFCNVCGFKTFDVNGEGEPINQNYSTESISRGIDQSSNVDQTFQNESHSQLFKKQTLGSIKNKKNIHGNFEKLVYYVEADILSFLQYLNKNYKPSLQELSYNKSSDKLVFIWNQSAGKYGSMKYELNIERINENELSISISKNVNNIIIGALVLGLLVGFLKSWSGMDFVGFILLLPLIFIANKIQENFLIKKLADKISNKIN